MFITSSMTENGWRLRPLVPQIISQEPYGFSNYQCQPLFVAITLYNDNHYLDLPLNHIFTYLSYTQVDLQVQPLLNCSLLYLVNLVLRPCPAFRHLQF